MVGTAASCADCVPATPGRHRFVEHAASLGATSAESQYVNPDPALAKVLVAGAAAGREKIEELMPGAGQDAINGWNSAMHGFDYNLDHLGLGTLDRPDWKIQDRAQAYATRAAAARGGSKLQAPGRGPGVVLLKGLSGRAELTVSRL